MIKKIIFIIFLFLFGFFIIFIKKPSCQGYFCLSFKDINKYKIKELYEDTDKAYRAIIKNGDLIIRLEVYQNINSETAKKFNQYKIVQMEGLFENIRSPYPGAISDEIACEQKYKPKVQNMNKNGLDKIYFSGYLNDRLQYGSCIDEQNIYKGYTVLFYCTDQYRWYQFEIIGPINRLSDRDYLLIIESISCEKPSSNIGKIFP